ncbi:hypothetical protein L7F22_062945 [Adiantum nelumboides]|nr:hypothetical protein [Adiantum nelumboides]
MLGVWFWHQRYFSKAGKVIDCSVHYDQDGKHQGTALVEYSNESGVHTAIEKFHGFLFYGSPLDLVWLAPENALYESNWKGI